MNKKFRDLTGERIWNWEVLGLAEYKNKKRYWKVRCTCGSREESELEGWALLNGKCAKYCSKCRPTPKPKLRSKKGINHYILDGKYGIGYTSKGKEFYFDLDDYELIKDYSWGIGANGYVQAHVGEFLSDRDGIDTEVVLMHQLIIWKRYGKDPNNVIDHHNRNKNDNRKENLQVKSAQENAVNSSLSSLNTSGYTGVSYYAKYNKWVSNLVCNGKTIFLGYHSNIEDAVKARLEAELKYFGPINAPQRHLFKKYGIGE